MEKSGKSVLYSSYFSRHIEESRSAGV